MAKLARCSICDKELIRNEELGKTLCLECADTIRRADRAAYVPHDALVGPEAPRLQIPGPAIGVHLAGPVHDRLQTCVRCGALLACERVGGRDGPVPPPGLVPPRCYPVGALVQRGKGWQAMKLSAGDPDCEALA